LFDVAVRDVLRAPSATTRNALEGVAWSLWGLQLAYPVLVDVSFAWNRYGYDLARDLFWQDAVTLTLAGAVDLALRDLAGRARPPVYDCLVAGGNSCLAGQDSTRSFPGGHMVNSTAASVLTCTQHLYVQLYGGAWDTLVCATTLASDAAIGVLRIVSDNHWASDQIAGAALGAAMGWGVPYVMHFRGRARASATGASRGGAHDVLVLPVPLALDHGAGVAVSGLF
jgi:membrane-associated phospholipid phosphatase